jgi:hypothetical protein
MSLSRLLLTCAVLCGVAGCRDPQDLVNTVNARVFVVGVEDSDEIVLDFDSVSVSAQPKPGSNLVEFALVLPVGLQTGAASVFKVKVKDGRTERKLRACGPISIVVPAEGEPASIAIVIDNLPECEDDEEHDEG